MNMVDEPQRITLDPDPPIHGQKLTICYDFSNLSLTSTTLRVTFTPSGTPDDYMVTPASPCITVTVPATATRILVEDLNGPSPDKQAPVI